jgi:hypothetical protein
MNYVDLHGNPVSKARQDIENKNFERDRFCGWLPKRITFVAYVAKYLGWKQTGRAS